MSDLIKGILIGLACPLLLPLMIDRKTEPTISKMEQVDKDINVRSKTEPQTNADQHVQRVEYVGNDGRCRCWKCKHFEGMHETPISSDGRYYTYVVCTASKCNYEPKDEPQTCSVNGRPYDCGNCEYHKCTADEPQTERPCDNCQEFDCYGCEYKQTERKE